MSDIVKQPELTFPLKVFVYGTLKKGFGNHGVLGKSKFIKKSTMFGVLLNLGGYPGFLPKQTGMGVHGEVYEVPDLETLNALDLLEGHPYHYVRCQLDSVGG